MPKRMQAIAMIALVSALTACSSYGEMPPLKAQDVRSMTCEQTVAEMAKINTFRAHVSKASEFSLWDVGSYFLDYGISDAIDEAYAEDSADERERVLHKARKAKNCPPIPALPIDAAKSLKQAHDVA
ncbi:hypothetical protein [Robbsia sp. KACC 23696]|uniref:hypothetical protein n=1 Tax=Robbsia sp. KACC 23696 TaxID=3149231 RepID=UPI00325BF7B8